MSSQNFEKADDLILSIKMQEVLGVKPELNQAEIQLLKQRDQAS